MKAISRTLPLIGALLAAGQIPAQQGNQSFGTPKQTTVQELESKPEAYKNVWVTFTGTFAGVGVLHNPFFTRFTRADHVNFAMWGDEARIWIKEEFDRPCPTLFVSKLNDATSAVLYQLQHYRRIQVTGIVRNAFQGKPWIEITEILPQAQRYTTTSLAHLHRAHNYVESHDWKKAGVELGLAQNPELPTLAKGWIEYQRGLSLMSIGQPQKARIALQAAKTLLGEDHAQDQDIDGKLALLEKDPKEAIDDTVRHPQIAKSRRPFWEAVEQQQAQEKASEPSPGR